MAYVGGPRLFVFVPSEQCERIYKPRCTFNRKGGLNFLRVTSEMEKAADAADMSVLFFSAGANF